LKASPNPSEGRASHSHKANLFEDSDNIEDDLSRRDKILITSDFIGGIDER
jgi:hypothetical protein